MCSPNSVLLEEFEGIINKYSALSKARTLYLQNGDCKDLIL